MSDVVVPTARWVVPGGVVRLDQPGQRLVPAVGFERVDVIGGVYLTAAARGAAIDPRVRLVLPADFAAPGAVQCAASDARLGCEIDLAGLPKQGVQLVRYPSTAADPTGVVLDGLYVYNNSIGPADPDRVGYHHGVYFQDSVGARGRNLRFRDLLGGRALHFYPRARSSAIERVTSERCYGDVVFWGAETAGNEVRGLLSLDVGGRGVAEWGGGASRETNTLDCVTSPREGYGYEEPTAGGLALRKLGETATTIALGWDSVADAVGFRFTRERAVGRWSHTWDGARTRATFSKDSAWYRVEALGSLAAGEYP